MKASARQKQIRVSKKQIEEVSAQIASLASDLKGTYGSSLLQGAKTMLSLARRIGDAQWIAKASQSVGNGYGHLGQHTESLKPLSDAIKIFTELGDLVSLIRCRSSIENSRTALGNTEEVYQSRLETLALARQTGDPQLIAPMLVRAGGAASWLGNDVKALELLKEGLEIASNHGFTREMQYGNIGLSEIALKNNEKEEALFRVKEAMKFTSDASDSIWKSRLFGQLGLVLSRFGKFEKSIAENKKSLHFAEEVGSLDAQCLAHRHLCDVYRTIRRYDLALVHGSAALKFARLSKNVRYISIALSEIGKVNQATHDHGKAIKYFKEAAKLAAPLKASDIACIVNEELSAIYKKKKDFRRALAYFEIHKLKHEEHEREETRLKLKAYEIDLELEKERREAEIAKNRAEQLERELVSRAQILASQTELIATFREDLRHIIRRIEVRDPAINELIAKLKELPDGVDWVKFEKEFTAVHPEFRSKLTEKYPELTKQEIKMCQLVRLGLKTYEMSRLLCLSERTIDGHRNGLRKKLGIKPSDNLKDFLQGIR